MDDPIPSIFQSVEHDAPFETCCRCEQALIDIDAPYIINKQFDRGECVLEFALCQPCHTAISDEMSEESKQHMQDFMEQNTDMETRSEELQDQPLDEWIKCCLACGQTPVSKGSFSLGGMVVSGDFIYNPYPLMICGDCQSQVESELSEQTRKRWDRFISDHFDGPPADAETPPKRTPMLI